MDARLIVAAALALAGCAQADAPPGMLRVGISSAPMTLDPRFATDAASVRLHELVHCRLVRLDAHFAPSGELAADWTHPDPYTWAFRLRSGQYFHDGRPVRAEDVVATLRSILSPALRSPLAGGLSAVRAVEAEGNRVVIRLRRPDASLPARLSIGVLPASQARDGRPHPRDAIGCGPYRVVRWTTGAVDLARVRGGGVARLRVVVTADPTTRALKLARGELDLIQGDIPAHLIPFFHRRGLSVVTAPATTFAYLGLNLRRPPLNDRRVRRALALAIDRRALKRALFADLPTLAETVLPAEHWAGVRLAPTPFDPAAAERLLDRAGWPRGPDGVRFHLTYRTSTNPDRLRLAQAIQAMWARIGVRVTIESLEWGAFYARVKRGDFDVFSLAWVGVTDPDIYRWILHSTMTPPRGANRGGFVDPEVDRWLDRAAAIDDPARRAALYRRVARRMHEAFVYLPLWREPVVAVYGPRVCRYRPPPDGGFSTLIRARPCPPTHAAAPRQGG